MKSKFTLLFVSIIFCAILVACTAPIPFGYDKQELNETVVRVELIYYHQQEVEEVSDFFGTAHRQHLDFSFTLVEYLVTLDEVYHINFFSELSSITFNNHITQDNTPFGIAVVLHFENGGFDVFSEFYLGRYDENGIFVEFFGDGLKPGIFREIVTYHFGIIGFE